MNLSSTGTMVFKADGSYTVTLTTTRVGTALVPKSCLGNVTCWEVQRCSDDGTNCKCPLTLDPLTSMEAGTYTTSQGTIHMMPTMDVDYSINYCVTGNQLAFTQVYLPMIVINATKS